MMDTTGGFPRVHKGQKPGSWEGKRCCMGWGEGISRRYRFLDFVPFHVLFDSFGGPVARYVRAASAYISNVVLRESNSFGGTL